MKEPQAPSTKVDLNVNYYDILELIPKDTDEAFDPSQITHEQIKKSYKKLAMIHHPDRGGNQQMFESINTAYEILKNEESRKQIDVVWAQKRQRLEYEKTLNQKTRTLREQLEQREKRYREEQDGQQTFGSDPKRKRMTKEDVDRIKTTGYSALQKIQEEHRKRQEQLKQQRDNLMKQQQQQQSPTTGASSKSSPAPILIAKWKDKIEPEELQKYLETTVGPIDKFVKMKGKKKAIITFRSEVGLTTPLMFGLKLKSAD